MKVISTKEYLEFNYPKIKNYPKLLQSLTYGFVKSLIKESEINKFLQENENKDAFSYIDSILDYFDVGIKVNLKQIERIPQYGRVIIIANHPLGALDAIALLHLIKEVRKDIKIVANSFLTEIENLKELLIPVDNINGSITKESLKSIKDALNKGEAIIIFPSGEVSRPALNGILKEKKWQKGFYTIATKTKSPILPIYIDAKNSKSFYCCSLLSEALSVALLPREMFNFKGKDIKFQIGNLIPFESYNMPNLSKAEAVKMLKKHLFRIAKGKKGLFKEHKGIALPENPSEIKNELILKGKMLGRTSDNKMIIVYSSSSENCVLKEIGRLRELTFRHVGEGTGKRRDIDRYDFHYKHIVIWDDNNLEIAGAYRVADCRQIVDEYGVEGLYTSTLFKFSKTFKPYFNNALELGRSFVQPKYWNSKALDYLWQGVGAYIRENPNIRYLFGPVSISNSYTMSAKSLLIYFYKNYFGAKEQKVFHKEPFTIPLEYKEYAQAIFCNDDYKSDFKILSEELKFLGLSIPTLFKQYSQLCEKGGVEFHDFGLDKDFNDCIDGFIFVDLDYLKESKRKRYIGQ